MRVVARFFVQTLAKNAGDSAQVTLTPVTSKENARWSQYTPSGSITMALTRKASGARSAFEANIGRECLVTFDFDAPPAEQAAYLQNEGYVSDEEPPAEVALT